MTVAKNDRLVKVWYRVRPTNENEPDDFTYIYLPHPRGVTSVCWRHSELQQQYVDLSCNRCVCFFCSMMNVILTDRSLLLQQRIRFLCQCAINGCKG